MTEATAPYPYDRTPDQKAFIDFDFGFDDSNPTAEEAAPGWEAQAIIDPCLEAMAAVYGRTISVDTDALKKSLPSLQLPGTPAQSVELEVRLRGDSLFRDVYDAERTPQGSRAVVYFSQRDVKKGKNNQAVVLPALRETMNRDNPALTKKIRRYEAVRSNALLFKAIGSIAVPTAAAVLGALELQEEIGSTASEALAFGGGMSAFLASFWATLYYGVNLSQKAELRRHPAQKADWPMAGLLERLPPIVHFSDEK